MIVTQELITPVRAKQILAQCPMNRRVNLKRVAKLALEIVKGDWSFNGDTIRIDSDGNLIDGQHRLRACVLANTPIMTLIAVVTDKSAFATIDTGKARSCGDSLSALGVVNGRNAAAALKFVHSIESGDYVKMKHEPVSNNEMMALHTKYPSVSRIIGHCTNVKLMQPAAFAGLYYLFSKKDKELADIFFEHIKKGMSVDNAHVFNILRERLIANQISKSKLKIEYVVALCIKAWNYARIGAQPKQLRWNSEGVFGEPFPVIK